MEREGWKIRLLIIVTGLLVAIFIVYPLWKVFTLSTAEAFLHFFTKPYFLNPFFNSIILGAAVAMLGTTIGFVLAYSVVSAKVPFAKAFDTLGMIPAIAPPFMVAISTIMLFGRNGIIVRHLFGGHEPFSIYGFPGLLITETLAYFPTAFLVLKGTLSAIHSTFEEAARSLGAGRIRTFFKIILPLCLPGLMSAFLLVFIESLADFGNPIILSGGYQVLSVSAFLEITAVYDIPGGAVLAIMLLIPSVIAYAIQKYILSRRSYVTVAGKVPRANRRSSPFTVALCAIFCFAVSACVALCYGMIAIGAFVKLWGADYALTLSNFVKGLEMGWQYVAKSVWIAAVSAPVTGILGMLIAYLVTRKRFFGRRALEFVSMLAFALPGTVVGIGYIMAFNEPHWFFPFTLQGTFWIILLLFVFRNMPVGLQAATAGLAQIDVGIEEAARTLGAGPLTLMKRIVVPLLAPAFFSGVVYSFVRAMTQISAVIFVVSGKWNLLTVFLLGLVENGELSIAAAMGIVLILIVVIMMGILKFVLHRWQVRAMVKAAW
jgi:iron(III) transport system permease protein